MTSIGAREVNATLRDTASLLRLSEWLLIAYFTYVAILSLLLPVDGWVAVYTWGVNLVVLLALSSLARAERATGWWAWAVLRDWLPVALVVVAYKEMGWFAPEQHTYELERTWIQWDRVLLYHWGFKAAIESTGSWAPSLLELSYALVYFVGPLGVAALYGYSSRREVDRFLVVLLLGTLLSYALYPFFPSEPPRTVFPGEDAPAVNTLFRRFNWWLLGGGGIHTSPADMSLTPSPGPWACCGRCRGAVGSAARCSPWPSRSPWPPYTAAITTRWTR